MSSSAQCTALCCRASQVLLACVAWWHTIQLSSLPTRSQETAGYLHFPCGDPVLAPLGNPAGPVLGCLM